MKSNFGLYSFVWVTLTFILIIGTLISWTILLMTIDSVGTKDTLMLILPPILTFGLAVTFREIKFKWNAIEISGTILTATSFFGLGKSKKWDLSKLKGFTTTIENVKTESILTMNVYNEDNQRILEMTSSTYDNFADIARHLSTKIKNIGTETFGLKDTIKSSFGYQIKYADKQNAR